MTKFKRKAFNLYSIIAGITLMAVTGTVVVPSAQNYYTKQRVKETVAKEKLLVNLYQQYYLGDDSVENATQLVDKAIVDGILPANIITSNFIENGFGEDFELDITDAGANTPAFVTIDANMGDGDINNEYAQIAYETMTTSVSGVSEKIGNTNRYPIVDLNDEAKQLRLANTSKADEVLKNDLTESFNGREHVTKENAVDGNEGQEWWEYDASTDTFKVNTWDTVTGDWAHTETISAKGRTAHENEYVNDIADIDASSVATGTKRVDSQGIEHVAIDGVWQTQPEATSQFVDVPNPVERFKDMLDRESTKNYYNAKVGEKTTIQGIWGKDIEVEKGILYWKSTALNWIPNYKNYQYLSQQNIYLSDDLVTLPTDSEIVKEGDVAFLRVNNKIDGYKGIQEVDNSAGKLYPEAVYIIENDIGNWRYYAPNIGDVLRLGFVDFNYYTQDTNDLLIFGGYDTLGHEMKWWSDKDYKIMATQGDRRHFPNLATEKYTNADYYLSVEKGLQPIHSNIGAISEFKYTEKRPLIQWGYVKTEHYDNETTNYLSDVVEGDEVAVADTLRGGNQGGDQQILQLNKYTGNYLVLYSGENIDNSGLGIAGKIYSGDGMAVTTEFVVNDNTDGNQYQAHATTLNNGNFVVTWNSKGNIKAKLYNENAQELSDEITVSGDGTSSYPQVADTYSSPTKFVVTWESQSVDGDEDGTGIALKEFTVSNDIITPSSEICASPTSMMMGNGDQHKPKILALNSGNANFIVVYENGNKLKSTIYNYDDNNNLVVAKTQDVEGKTDVELSGWIGSYEYLTHSKVGIVSNNGNNISVVDINVANYNKKEVSIISASNPTISYNMSKLATEQGYIVAYQKSDDIKYTIYKSDMSIKKTDTLNTKYQNGIHTNPNITAVIANTFAVTWEASGIDDVSVGQNILAKTVDIKEPTQIFYTLDNEFIVNNINKTGDQINPMIVSLREKYAYDYIKKRYIAIVWSGTNDDTTGTKVNLRRYTISNYKYLERNNED